MIDTRFDTSIDLRGEIENYRQVALIKYYKMLLEIDPKKDRLTLLAVLRCIDKLERHSQERKRPRCDRKKMQADGTLAWHYQKRNQLFRKAGLYDIESTQYLVDHEEIFDTPEEREERERFEACRREALRKQEERKNEENEKAASHAGKRLIRHAYVRGCLNLKQCGAAKGNYLEMDLPTECRSWQDSMTRSDMPCSAFFR